MSKVLLYGNTTTGNLSETLAGGSYAFPDKVQGDTLTLQLRLAENTEGVPTLIQRTVTSLKVGLGQVDTRPAAGTLALKSGSGSTVVGTNCTTPLQFNAPVDTVAAQLNALGTGAFTSAQLPLTVEADNGSWLVRSADGTVLALSAGANELEPVAFVRVREWQDESGAWVSEVRLMVACCSFEDSSQLVAPPIPTVTEVVSGVTISGVNQRNEVQALNVPPTFLGTYALDRGSAQSSVFDITDRVADIQKGIAAIADTGGNFLVSNPTYGVFYIEFQGTMGGASQPLLGVTIVQAPPSDLTLTLSLEKEELDRLLRATAAASPGTRGRTVLPLEIQVKYQDPNSSTTIYTATFTGSVGILQQLLYDELATYPQIAWNNPPLRPSITPFTPSQVTVGGLNRQAAVPQGAPAHIFVIIHDFNAVGLVVELEANSLPATKLVRGTDYTAVETDMNTLTITMVDGVNRAVGSMLVSIGMIGQQSVFLAHTHTAAQIIMPDGVTTLAEYVATINSSIAALNTAVGLNPFSSAPSAATAAIQGQTWTLKQYAYLFGVKSPVGSSTAAAIKLGPANPISAIDPTTLPPHGGGLLPAIRTSEFTGVSALPGSPTPGVRYVNNGSSPITIPPGLSHNLATANVGDSFAWSGHVFYKLQQYAQDTQVPTSTYTVNTGTGIITVAAGGYTPTAGDLVQLLTTVAVPTGYALATDFLVYSDGTHFYLKATSGAFSGDIITPSTTGSGTQRIGISPPANAWWYPEMDVYLGGFACNSAQLRLGLQLAINVGFEIGLVFGTRDISANLEGAFQYVFVIEWQSILADTAPIPGSNLGALAWNPVPLLAQPIVLSAVPVVCGFGVTILRQLVGGVDTITATQTVFGGASGALSAPSSADLRFRFRLVRGDTPDNNPAPRGFIAVRGMSLNSLGTDGSGSGIGIAQISQIQS